jgi:hypothetical protein
LGDVRGAICEANGVDAEEIVGEQAAVGLAIAVGERLPHLALESDELLDVVFSHVVILPNGGLA